MDFNEWKDIYEDIIEDFGYSKEKDSYAANLLSELRGTDSIKPLKEIKGKVIDISGPFITKAYGDYKIAAGSTLKKMNKIKLKPDLIVTDLDGDTKLQVDYNNKGIPIVIHAHGDNIDILKEWAPKLKGTVISTCQSEPVRGVYNFGGFTDGDRAALIADHFGAEKIILNGWKFDEPFSKNNKRVKGKKLRWAEKILNLIDTPITQVY
ncbi:MAG: 6-hydroxymethylpterin diphosphokinase MptE-like protein [Thermoplasmatota archaeon]